MSATAEGMHLPAISVGWQHHSGRSIGRYDNIPLEGGRTTALDTLAAPVAFDASIHRVVGAVDVVKEWIGLQQEGVIAGAEADASEVFVVPDN